GAGSEGCRAATSVAPARATDRRRLGRSRPLATSEADAGSDPSARAAREPGPTAADGVRRPAVDRQRDAGVSRLPRRGPPDGGDPARGELSAGVPARLDPQDVLPAVAGRSLAARERRSPAY